MMHIVVYYGYENPKDIRVSIDGMPSVDARKHKVSLKLLTLLYYLL